MTSLEMKSLFKGELAQDTLSHMENTQIAHKHKQLNMWQVFVEKRAGHDKRQSY